MKAEKEEHKEEKMIERDELKGATHGHKDGVAGTSLDAEAIGKSLKNLVNFSHLNITDWTQRLA